MTKQIEPKRRASAYLEPRVGRKKSALGRMPTWPDDTY